MKSPCGIWAGSISRHARLAPPAADGLVAVDGWRVAIPPQGRPFARIVAAAFDAYLHRAAARHAAAV